MYLVDPLAFDALVLELHTACRERTLRAFQTYALDRLRTLVPFDSALVAVGTVADGIPDAHDAFLYRQTPALMESWETVKHEDTVSFVSTSNPGRTHTFVAEETYPASSGVLAHCKRFGILQLMTTATINERAGSFVVLSLYRARATPRYSEDERVLVERIVPHLVASTRHARIDELRRATQVSLAYSPAAAIVNRKATVLEAEPRFVDLIASRYPAYRGPALPSALASLAQVSEPTRQVVDRLVVRADPAADVVLLHARQLLPVDTLTEREREVASSFAMGLSTKEIADELGIAPNTVRVHVGRVYEKLGIGNKAELASMIAGLDWLG